MKQFVLLCCQRKHLVSLFSRCIIHDHENDHSYCSTTVTLKKPSLVRPFVTLTCSDRFIKNEVPVTTDTSRIYYRSIPNTCTSPILSPINTSFGGIFINSGSHCTMPYAYWNNIGCLTPSTGTYPFMR